MFALRHTLHAPLYRQSSNIPTTSYPTCGMCCANEGTLPGLCKKLLYGIRRIVPATTMQGRVAWYAMKKRSAYHKLWQAGEIPRESAALVCLGQGVCTVFEQDTHHLRTYSRGVACLDKRREQES